ncbi:MAG: hypothetical protein QXI19_07680 [Candidatus Caldarchaeum sp.]
MDIFEVQGYPAIDSRIYLLYAGMTIIAPRCVWTYHVLGNRHHTYTTYIREYRTSAITFLLFIGRQFHREISKILTGKIKNEVLA